MHVWHLLPIGQCPGRIRIDADAIHEERGRATHSSEQEIKLRERVLDGYTSKINFQSEAKYQT
jgi:hypothetical protein